MLVVDAQVHIWSQGTPSANHRQISAFTKDDLLAEMAEGGVDAAVIHPPTTWDPDANEIAIEAARLHPERFCILGNMRLDEPENRARVATWRQQPGMVGFRFSFTGQGQSSWLTDGTADWLWAEAERAGTPIALLAGRNLAKVGEIAQQYPGLRLLIDHLGAPPGVRGQSIWSNLPDMLALAKYPNVAIKATGAPSYSSEEWPYRDTHEHLRSIYETFGPRRMFWGTDITRMPCTWDQCVRMFTEEMPWLKGDDLELVMGRAVCDWLDWLPPAA